MSGASEVFGLAQDLGHASGRLGGVLFDVFKQGGDEFAKDWAVNARATSGVHGKHYPNSIDSETRVALGIHVETGPNSAMPQGRMGRGFELGSRNQPPHLDGLRALPMSEARLLRAADTAVALLVR